MQAGSVFRNRYSLTGWRWRSPNAIWCGADQVEEPWGPVALKMYALTSDFIREKELLDMPYSSEHWPSKHYHPLPSLLHNCHMSNLSWASLKFRCECKRIDLGSVVRPDLAFATPPMASMGPGHDQGLVRSGWLILPFDVSCDTQANVVMLDVFCCCSSAAHGTCT